MNFNYLVVVGVGSIDNFPVKQRFSIKPSFDTFCIKLMQE
ncbi:hypothetical protein GXM_07279 [Nostoc sphaeroides CCNUC1]|uniref:Uncharacterized protein n=1 Tax=Nostoc sphaeroides CCNUC1 TaxID=2653204 RepID=A0A5P8WAG4_9NOSO|nr:hypothetical protein GXM_07279 [Nostoc sphaeroides CCNUC1]